MEELQVLEPDERGWEVVYKDSKFYRKKTFIHDNGITRVYEPIPMRKKEKQ